MDIRQAQLTDLKEISKINVDNWKTTYMEILPESYLSKLTTSECLKKWQQFLDNSCNELLVVEKNQRIAGFIAISNDVDTSNALYVNALHVLHDYQGMGIGTKLLMKALSRAKDGKKHMTISILKGNENARKLYSKLGAEHLKDFTDHFDDVITKSEMLIWL